MRIIFEHSNYYDKNTESFGSRFDVFITERSPHIDYTLETEMSQQLTGFCCGEDTFYMFNDMWESLHKFIETELEKV